MSSGRKFHGYSSLKEYYEQESCVHYIHNVSNLSLSSYILLVPLLLSLLPLLLSPSPILLQYCIFLPSTDFY